MAKNLSACMYISGQLLLPILKLLLCIGHNKAMNLLKQPNSKRSVASKMMGCKRCEIAKEVA